MRGPVRGGGRTCGPYYFPHYKRDPRKTFRCRVVPTVSSLDFTILYISLYRRKAPERRLYISLHRRKAPDNLSMKFHVSMKKNPTFPGNMNSCKPCDDLGWKIDGASDTDLERNTIESKIASPNIPDVNTKQQLTRHCVQNMTNIGPWCDVMPFQITGSVPPPRRRLLLPRRPLGRLGPPRSQRGAP